MKREPIARPCQYKLTPSLLQHVKFPGERCTDTSANSIFSGPVSHLLSMLCVLRKILSEACAKERRLKDVRVSNLALLLVVFK